MVVHAIWVALLIVHLAMVVVYTTNYPFSDELGLITQRLSLDWLWRQHAEHRVPAAKLIWLGTLRLTNYNFRVGNCLSVLMVGTVALAMMRTAARLRGRASLLDSFFPLAFFNFGQAVNFLWWWVVNHLLAPMLACCALLLIVRTDTTSKRIAVLLGVCTILLALSGPGGLPYALALAGWLVYRALCPPSPAEPRHRLLLGSMGLIAASLVGAYFVNYDPMPGLAAGQVVATASLKASLKASLQVLAVTFGPAVASHWRSIGLFTVVLLAISLAMVLVAFARDPLERPRALGLLLFAGAAGAVFTVVGHARAGLGEEYALTGIYLNMGLPTLCLIYLAWIMYGKLAIGSFVQACLLAITVSLVGGNYDTAIATAEHWNRGRRSFEQEMHAGVPPFILSEHHVGFLNPAARSHEPIARALVRMRDAKIPQFSRLTDDPTFRQISLPVVPSRLNGVTWVDGVAWSQLRDPRAASISFRLPEARVVYAVRMKCHYGRRSGPPASLRLAWQDERQPAADSSACAGVGTTVETEPPDLWARRFRSAPDKTVTLWVNSAVSEFRICPDTQSFAFGVSEIALLVP